MRKIFIDCGFYTGQSIRLFKKRPEFDQTFEFFAFEPAISPKQAQQFPNITIYNKAVWIYDGEIEFKKSKRRKGKANGLFRNPFAYKEVCINVQCIDFSQWIKDNFSKEDYIVIKMDIEGAEYEVLDKMLKDNTVEYVDLMFIEYHYDRRSDIDKKDFLELRRKMIHESGVKCLTSIEWLHKRGKGKDIQ